MATLSFNGESFTVDHAVKGANYVHGYDASGNVIVSLEGVIDFSDITYDGTYMAPGDCLPEPCNDVKYCSGVLQTRGGEIVNLSKMIALSATGNLTDDNSVTVENAAGYDFFLVVLSTASTNGMKVCAWIPASMVPQSASESYTWGINDWQSSKRFTAHFDGTSLVLTSAGYSGSGCKNETPAVYGMSIGTSGAANPDSGSSGSGGSGSGGTGSGGTGETTPVPGDDGGYYIPVIADNEDATGKVITFTPSKEGMDVVAPFTIYNGTDNLPIVSANDNGKVLRVVDGVWAAATIANAEEASF